MAVIYVVAQSCGAFMGYGLLVTVTPVAILKMNGASFCVTKPFELVSIPQAFCIEFLATATLVWFVCGIWDPRNARHHDSVAIRFALAVAGLASATVSFCLNIRFFSDFFLINVILIIFWLFKTMRR